MHIKEYLKSHRLITDGAMGTYYEEKYGRENGLAERANDNAPEKIKEIHLDYLKNGARLLRTNTFATNTMFFSDIEAVEKNIQNAHRIAKEAKKEYQMQCQNQDEPVFIAADIGPIYDSEQLEYESVLEEYKRICDISLACGADCILFETQSDFTYLKPLFGYLKEKSDVFVIAQFSFDKSGYTRSGLSVDRMIRTVADMDALDAYGFNCGVGATHMYELLRNLTFPDDKYLTALPNAGYPFPFRGRMLYSDNVSYYVEEMKKIAGLGVEIVGGCCGSTPRHIKALRESLLDEPFAKKRIGDLKNASVGQVGSAFARKLSAGEKVYIAELEPPFQTDITKVMEGARQLAEAKVDMITLSDSPMARIRMDAVQLAARLQQELNVPVMPHICCRDKNVIALRAGMLGAYMNQLRHFLLITGDPVARGDRDYVTSVFDFNSIKLMNYVNSMNEDVFAQEPVIFGGALNYHGVNVNAIIERMKRKIENGCRYFLTQPIYTDEDVERIRYLKEHVDTKILCGIMPLVSYKNAMFVKNEMPGIQVSEAIVNRYRPDMTREEAQQAAIDISVEIAKKLADVADGFYFMTPFNRTGLIRQIMETIRKEAKE